MSQLHQIRSHLDKGNSLTPIEALRKFGCMRLAARCYDLRASGYPVITNIRIVTTKMGTEARIAEYIKGAK